MQIIGISTESINEAFANYDIKELVKRSLASKAKKYGIDLKVYCLSHFETNGEIN